MSDSKPRELAIILQDGILPPLVMQSVSEAEALIDMRIKRSNKPTALHVIEYSAFEALQIKCSDYDALTGAYEAAIKERDAAEASFGDFDKVCTENNQLRKERDEARAERADEVIKILKQTTRERDEAIAKNVYLQHSCAEARQANPVYSLSEECYRQLTAMTKERDEARAGYETKCRLYVKEKERADQAEHVIRTAPYGQDTILKLAYERDRLTCQLTAMTKERDEARAAYEEIYARLANEMNNPEQKKITAERARSQKLVEALRGHYSPMCRIDSGSICKQCQALAEYAKDTTTEFSDLPPYTVAGNPSDSECATTRPLDQLDKRGKLQKMAVDSVGIYFHKASGKWAAQIRHGKTVEHIGLFKDKLKACRAYDKRARALGKKVLNFVNPND